MHSVKRRGRVRPELYRVLHDLTKLSPIGKVAFIHAFLDRCQDPANAGDIFGSAVLVRAAETSDDARPCAFVGSRHLGNQVLRFAISLATL